jgi:pilus assembly protein CpaB
MVLLIAAVLVAALGTGLVFVYVARTDERALQDQEPVQVLVAKTRIEAGTLVSNAEREGAFRLQAIPRSALIEGYLTDTRQISSLTAVSDIFPGEQIIAAKFAVAGTTTGLPIPDDKMAISVQLGDPQRVAGFVKPGSDVTLIVLIRAVPRAGQPPVEVSRVLLPRVGVIAVGPTTLRPAEPGQGNTEPLPTALLTLAVDQLQAQKIAYATRHGQLYFTLLTKESKVAPGQPVTIDNLFS